MLRSLVVARLDGGLVSCDFGGLVAQSEAGARDYVPGLFWSCPGLTSSSPNLIYRTSAQFENMLHALVVA